MRWYDPSIGRFLSRDPKGQNPSVPESFNLYNHANDSPTFNVDPSGADTCNAWNPFTWSGCAPTAGNFLANSIHLGGVGNSLSKDLSGLGRQVWHGLQTLGNLYWSNTINTLQTLGNAYWSNTLATTNAIWNGLNLLGNMLYFSYVTGPIEGWNSPNRDVRTYYRCEVMGAITAVGLVGGYYATAAIPWETVWAAIREGTVIQALSRFIPRLIPYGAFLPVAGYWPGPAELANAAWEVGSGAYTGCFTGIASYL